MTSVSATSAPSLRMGNSLLWLIAIGVGAWFVAKNVPHYFVFTEES